jgi:hypothetical protein
VLLLFVVHADQLALFVSVHAGTFIFVQVDERRYLFCQVALGKIILLIPVLLVVVCVLFGNFLEKSVLFYVYGLLFQRK